MLKAVLLALAITWPPGVELSSGAICRVIYTAGVKGPCAAADERISGLAYWWTTCIAVEWAGRGPNGEDILSEKPIWRGSSRSKAIAQCEQVMKAYEKARKAK